MEVVFGGYLINEKGYVIDPAGLTALSDFPVPNSQPDIKPLSFYGITNQMCNFSDDISEVLAPFKHFLKKGQKFEWNDNLQAVFKAAQRHLTSAKTLAFYFFFFFCLDFGLSQLTSLQFIHCHVAGFL
jgi:hypothetical protein